MLMNRKQRRAAAEKVKNNPDELAALIKQECLEAVRGTAKAYGIVVGLVLRDKLGFGQDRIDRFLNQVSEVFDSIDQGYLTIEDIEKVLKDETGIVIK